MSALCILCMDNSSDEPLGCGHVFHESCIAQVFKSIGRQCPMCRLETSIESTGARLGWKFVEFVNASDPTLIHRFLNDSTYKHVTSTLILSLIPGSRLNPNNLFDVSNIASLPFIEFIKYVNGQDSLILKRFASHAIGYGRDGLEFITVCFLIEHSANTQC